MMALEPQLDAERVQLLNNRGKRSGEYVLYWIQAAQRVADNHALE